MKIKSLILIAMTLMFSAVSASAAERFVIDVNDAEFKGQSEIQLRKALHKRFGINTDFYNIKHVALVAKSRQGQGSAILTVGPYASPQQNIGGNPLGYRDSSPQTFDRLHFFYESRNDEGPWQLHLRGNIKVRKIVVVLVHERNDHGRDDWDRPGRGDRDDDFSIELN